MDFTVFAIVTWYNEIRIFLGRLAGVTWCKDSANNIPMSSNLDLGSAGHSKSV